MPVLMTSDLPGVTDEGYRHLADALVGVLRTSEGFIAHAAGPVDGGYRVTELWESQAAHEAWFTRHVLAAMPPGAPAPSVEYRPVSAVVTA